MAAAPSPHGGVATGESARLAERIQRGDGDAEAELVERFSRGVRFLLGGLTRDASRTDDLHQETFRLAIGKIRAGELREPEKLAGFIRQIARNLFIADYRKAVRQAAEALDENGGAAPADPAPNALSRVIEAEDARLVRHLLAELQPPRYRELLVRFYLCDEAKERLCAEFGLSSLQFNVVLHRARGRFKELVARSPLAVNAARDLTL